MPRADAHTARRAGDPRHVEWMRRAISVARSARPHPNPRVGALVIGPDGSIIAEAAHVAAGEAHAEALAITMSPPPRGSTLVVTLEPCAHQGRTPPCTEALIEAGIARVVIGARDPDPQVSGRGIAQLRSAGVDVVTSILPDEVEAADPGYFHHRRTGRPRMTLKLAMTLDGQAAAADGTSRWITSPAARDDAHLLRAESDAVMVGAGTVLADDPQLTVRRAGFDGRQPRPIVVAGVRPLPTSARLMERDPLVFAPDEAPGVVSLPGPGGVELEAMVKYLGAEGVVDVLVEGGPTLAGSLWREGLIDRAVLYYGSRVAGGTGKPGLGGVFATLGDATQIEILDVSRLGPDLRVTVERVRPGPESEAS